MRIRELVPAVIMLGCALQPVHAAASRVEPGEEVSLGANQGLLLLAVDSELALYSATVNRPGKLLGPAVLRRVPVGVSHALFVVDAGTYGWQEIKPFANWYFRITTEDEFRFEVRAGELNYPGDLVVESSAGWIADVSLYNRGLQALAWMQAEHPEVLRARPLHYRGHYPDPFPAYLRSLDNAGSNPAPAAPTLPAIEFGPEQLSPQLLWQDQTLRGLTLSPDGRFLALHLRPDAKEEQWQVDLIDLVLGQRRMLARSVAPYRNLSWSGGNRLVLESGPAQAAIVELVSMRVGADVEVEYEHVRLVRRGTLVDALPDQPDHILLASLTRRDQLMVHRVDVSSQASATAFNGGFAKRLNKGLSNELRWLADGKGRLRLARVELAEEYVWMYGLDGQYKRLPEFEDPSFQPLGLSPEGDRIMGLSDHQRGQRELVEIDASSGHIVATLFAREGVDVTAPIMSSSGEPIGATYYRQGHLVSEYFDQRQAAWAERLRAAFPGASIDLAASSEDGATQLLWVDASDRPPQLYHFDRRTRTAALLLDLLPQLQGRQFVATRQIDVRRGDTTLEAFLTLPEGKTPRPLVVFPHGGPIGVADSLHFDPEVQFLAGLGYAVLQVNFRGSEGYGRAFREAAERNYGKLIEDDIDAAITRVLAAHPLDPKRICVLGSSYGGYSALIAGLRWPERFRCAASIAGVTDLPLQFTATDGAQSAKGRAVLERLMGDPNTDLAALQQASPVYRHAELKLPVLLAHGRADRRVDVEQSRRLERVLGQTGRPPVTLYFDDEGHNLNKNATQHQLWTTIAAFLQQHLGTESGAGGN